MTYRVITLFCVQLALENNGVFSGIVETVSPVLALSSRNSVVELQVGRPDNFSDLQVGDSVSVNGVCLTIESLGPDRLQFALGQETLAVTNWLADKTWAEIPVNLERSLKCSDRIHGHLVTGHVDGAGQVKNVHGDDQWREFSIEVPRELVPFLWKKGSVAVNGVSLTVNAVQGLTFTVGLIPETLRRTNLKHLKLGSTVNIEVDNMARGLVNLINQQRGEAVEAQLG